MGDDRQSKEETESYGLKKPLVFRGSEQGIVIEPCSVAPKTIRMTSTQKPFVIRISSISAEGINKILLLVVDQAL